MRFLEVWSSKTSNGFSFLTRLMLNLKPHPPRPGELQRDERPLSRTHLSLRRSCSLTPAWKHLHAWRQVCTSGVYALRFLTGVPFIHENHCVQNQSQNPKWAKLERSLAIVDLSRRLRSNRSLQVSFSFFISRPCWWRTDKHAHLLMVRSQKADF